VARIADHESAKVKITPSRSAGEKSNGVCKMGKAWAEVRSQPARDPPLRM
jgi:hypothetical protein